MFETLRARKLRNQVKEIKIKLIVYNINKKIVEIIYIKLRISTEPVLSYLIYRSAFVNFIYSINNSKKSKLII